MISKDKMPQKLTFAAASAVRTVIERKVYIFTFDNIKGLPEDLKVYVCCKKTVIFTENGSKDDTEICVTDASLEDKSESQYSYQYSYGGLLDDLQYDLWSHFDELEFKHVKKDKKGHRDRLAIRIVKEIKKWLKEHHIDY
jgi:hypothetical protein